MIIASVETNRLTAGIASSNYFMIMRLRTSRSRRRRFHLSRAWCLALLSVIGLASGACSRDRERPMPKKTARNVILVLIDTLRADKLGCYGNPLGLTPNIDKLAKEGFRFDQAFSHAPWTLPATASLLTSSYPQQHGAGGKKGGRGFQFTGLADGVRTIAECFYDEGYDTHAIVNVLFLDKRYGINRGFPDGEYDYKAPDAAQLDHRRATEVTDLALNWIEEHRSKSERPFFLMVHYFDPHLRYDPPAKFRQKYALPQDRTPDPRLFGSESDMIEFRHGIRKVTPPEVMRLEALYNGEIAYTDEEVGRLAQSLRDKKLDEQTLMVLTADHGEEFLDHEGFEHGHTLYDEMIRVPLVWWGPGLVKSGETDAAVGHVDVAPTVCALTGIPQESTFQGQNLEEWLLSGRKTPTEVFSQGNMWGPDLTALRVKGYKLIEKKVGREAYHVAEDPKERINLARDAANIEMCNELSKRMSGLMTALGNRPGSQVEQTDADRKLQDSLGYVARAAQLPEIELPTTTQPSGAASNKN